MAFSTSRVLSSDINITPMIDILLVLLTRFHKYPAQPAAALSSFSLRKSCVKFDPGIYTICENG